jgi:hypothetical protein
MCHTQSAPWGCGTRRVPRCERRWDMAGNMVGRRSRRAETHLTGGEDVCRLGQVSLGVHNSGVVQRVRRLGRDVEGDDSLCATLHQHLHQPLAHKPAAACHHAAGRHRRESLLGRHGSTCGGLCEGKTARAGAGPFLALFLFGPRRKTCRDDRHAVMRILQDFYFKARVCQADCRCRFSVRVLSSPTPLNGTLTVPPLHPGGQAAGLRGQVSLQAAGD